MYQNFIISPTYSAVFKSYSEDSPSHNDGREDLIHSLNVRLIIPITEFASISLLEDIPKEIQRAVSQITTLLAELADLHLVKHHILKNCTLNLLYINAPLLCMGAFLFVKIRDKRT